MFPFRNLTFLQSRRALSVQYLFCLFNWDHLKPFSSQGVNLLAARVVPTISFLFCWLPGLQSVTSPFLCSIQWAAPPPSPSIMNYIEVGRFRLKDITYWEIRGNQPLARWQCCFGLQFLLVIFDWHRVLVSTWTLNRVLWATKISIVALQGTVLELPKCLSWMCSLQAVFQKSREAFGSGSFSIIIRDVKKLGPVELDYRRGQTEKQPADTYYRQELFVTFQRHIWGSVLLKQPYQIVPLIKLLPAHLITTGDVKNLNKL